MNGTLTQQFADEYARGIVPAMMKAIGNSKWKTRLIMIGVFAVTYTHQAKFLAADPSIGWLGWVIPGINDLAMLTMVEILQTPGMSRDAKRGAAVMLGVCGGLSATVNVAAPGTMLARVVFGVLVAILVGAKLVTARIKPDFSEFERHENQATDAVKPVTRKCADDCTCRRHARAKVLTPQQKAAITKARKKADRELAAMAGGYVPADAPVSPALF